MIKSNNSPEGCGEYSDPSLIGIFLRILLPGLGPDPDILFCCLAHMRSTPDPPAFCSIKISFNKTHYPYPIPLLGCFPLWGPPGARLLCPTYEAASQAERNYPLLPPEGAGGLGPGSKPPWGNLRGLSNCLLLGQKSVFYYYLVDN